MNLALEPYADELLSSWLARRQSVRPAPFKPLLRAYRNFSGRWRHPDVHPSKSLIAELAAKYNIAPTRIAKLGLCYRYPRISPDFVSWRYAPPDFPAADWAPAPALRLAWCSRCLAEDYAAGRPAYIRADWAVAAASFCSHHHWPLVNRCVACGKAQWSTKRLPRGPPRMYCTHCHRGLERAHPKALEIAAVAQPIWDMIATFEAALRGALTGRVPDQFRFNNTSADQLLQETAQICFLFARTDVRLGLRDNLFDCFTEPALTLGEFCSDDSLCEMPLALAPIPLRRCLLAICAAILDASFDQRKTGLAKLAPDLWARIAGDSAFQHFIRQKQACSPTLRKQVEAACQRSGQRERILELSRSGDTLKSLFRRDSDL